MQIPRDNCKHLVAIQTRAVAAAALATGILGTVVP